MALYEPPGDEDGCRGASSPSASNSSSDHLSRLLDGPLEAAEAAAEAARLRPTEDSEEEEVTNDGARRRFRNLSEEHIAILSSLNQNQLLKVVDQICERQHPLDAVLDAVAADVAATVRKVAEQQRQADADASLDADQAAALAASNSMNKNSTDPSSSSDYFLHIARFVPLRLTFEERVFLRLLESTLEVSEYTDKIDILCGGSKARRMAREIRQVCAILSGLALAHNYEEGQRLVRDHDFVSNRAFFQTVFEIGRRYKILNPERMRSAYGKLIYLLMDAKKPEVLQLLQFDCVTPEIMPEGKSRAQIQREIKEKQNAIKTLARKYAGRDVPKHSPGFFGLRLSFFRSDSGGDEGPRTDAGDERSDLLTPDEIEQCLYSLGDHNTYLRFNREPCDRMIGFLRQYFDPSEPEEGYSLAISSGTGGARLTHSHSRQYVYVLQSLTLWREVCSEMFVLWQMAEADMLHSGNCYRLRDTGQGLNRVQDCPRVSNAMHAILERVQRFTTSWVGSSVVHLGDHNVPNALMFIDKYTQVPRILGPLVLCLEKLPEVYESKQAMRNYFDNQFGGLHALRKQILCDFFRHAFDGSGGDNFFDAGSCIDGRLTSAWNWCSTIEKKRFFPAFLLTGFQGFDGKF
ncbi:conserved hypothetical protein [Neospora caninum Liverpool]|uniref:Non-canonical E2 ubiquitin-conjugating enzyme C-terminal domain-containing protein n=1 Tax=Neospora caninum (strain Liverpool) TaxID=572307 RepID=F0VRP9_NEOCL|nr:conserved hypothetical protein [Neospora caninum Liverpool]CBZ56397.1 conserved hypothetical protein [Neospora caninum Liverpool]|eukprot:XP_003886422.1 conserved hypothetical protein [Neospora caninum Liverpool]